MFRAALGSLVAITLTVSFPSAAQLAPKSPEIMMINMGGNDCQPCVAWRMFELPKLKATEAFKAITFVHVTKAILIRNIPQPGSLFEPVGV